MDCLFPRFTFSDPGSKPQMDCQNQEYFIVVPEQVYTNLLASLLGCYMMVDMSPSILAPVCPGVPGRFEGSSFT
jgi:hypothetical protein